MFVCVYECKCMCGYIDYIPWEGWGGAGVEEKGVGCYLSFLSPIHVAFC